MNPGGGAAMAEKVCFNLLIAVHSVIKMSAALVAKQKRVKQLPPRPAAVCL